MDGSPSEAVELYTRALHNESFTAAATGDDQNQPQTMASHVVRGVDSQRLPWVEINSDDLGGAKEVVIRRIAVTSRDSNQSQHVVQKGTTLRIHAELVASDAKEEIVVGYLVRDRVGVAIFGENTITSGLPLLSFKRGEVKTVCFEIPWPEVHPGEYSITIGVGEGRHPMKHTIQCWAQNVFALEAITPGTVVHGIFNNPMSNLEVLGGS